MFQLRTVFEKNTNELPVKNCEIEKIVELPEAGYQSFLANLMQEAGFIAGNKELMYSDENNVQHCLLVLRDGSTEGVLIQSEGQDYATYASLLPAARDFVAARLNEMASQIIQEGTQNTDNGTWAVSYDDLTEQYGIHLGSCGGIGDLLADIMGTRPEIAAVEHVEDGYEMDFFMDYCPNINEETKQMLGIPDDVFRLKDLIRIPIEDFHLVHNKVDIIPATIVYLSADTLTGEGKQDWGDVLNSQVLRVFQGSYGIQVECAGVDPKRLANFSLMLAGYCPCEDHDRWIKDEPDPSGMTMKI